MKHLISAAVLFGSSFALTSTLQAAPITSNQIVSFESLYSKKCLDVAGASVSDGANVHQWTCNSTDAQKFYQVPVGDGTFYFVNKKSGKCLDIESAGRWNGANLQQWACHWGDNQRFYFNTDSGIGAQIRPVSDLGKCIDISGPSTAEGANLHQWSCHTGSSQRWVTLLVMEGVEVQ